MEFLVADVATRSLLMSFVKDNYGLLLVAKEFNKKIALCALCVDSAFSSPCTLSDPNDLTLSWLKAIVLQDGVLPNVHDITQISTDCTLN